MQPRTCAGSNEDINMIPIKQPDLAQPKRTNFKY